MLRVVRVIELNRMIIEENSLCLVEGNPMFFLVYQSLPIIPFKTQHNYTIIPLATDRQPLCGFRRV